MKHLTRGILIALEGIDGSGKTTLAHHLYDLTTAANLSTVVLTKEPGATPLGKHIRTLVQYQDVPVTPLAEFLLFAADRAQHFTDVILPALQERKIVISDRLSDSSLVYQGHGRGLDTTMIEQINAWTMQHINPDIVFYLKVPSSIAAQRLIQRGKHLSTFEKEHEHFTTKLIKGFDALLSTRNNVITLDGSQSADDLKNNAFNALVQWITTHNLLM